jgi:hypothetical protein
LHTCHPTARPNDRWSGHRQHPYRMATCRDKRAALIELSRLLVCRSYLERIHKLIGVQVTIHADLPTNAQLQMIVQAMPAQANPGGKAIYEEAVEALQRRSGNVPYVTIIHAYSGRKPVGFEDVPASPLRHQTPTAATITSTTKPPLPMPRRFQTITTQIEPLPLPSASIRSLHPSVST